MICVKCGDYHYGDLDGDGHCADCSELNEDDNAPHCMETPGVIVENCALCWCGLEWFACLDAPHIESEVLEEEK